MEKNNIMQNVMKKIKSLPEGSKSPKGHYWCVTCKKFFVLDKPICPYMTKMCINTPIAVEVLPPESTEALERFGLFYPKIPQKFISVALKNNFSEIGSKFARIYLDFLKEWNFNPLSQPLQTLKSFAIIISGCETAQRINKTTITFVIMDPEKVWKKDKLEAVLKAGLSQLRDELRIPQKINVDFINVFGERKIGKYYCQKRQMFFEFGLERNSVTCPLMSQKCMFQPVNIKMAKYSANELVKIYTITPDIYRRFIKTLETADGTDLMKTILKEWDIQEDADKIAVKLGVTEINKD